MRLKTIQANSIKAVFEVLKDIINDVNFVFTSTGVSVTTLDTAKVTFINMFLDASNFELYECPDKITAGLNISNTFKLLKMIGNNDTLELGIDPKMETLDMVIENIQKKSRTSFSMKLLDINEEEFSITDINHSGIRTTIPSVSFQRIIRDMSNFANQVEICRTEKSLILRCQGDYVQQTTEMECSSEPCPVPIVNSYSLKYISMFTKATNICANVSIMHSADGPISFKYSIANLGDIEFYLAPTAEN
jgi:proliferating cell nuclear antigen